MGRWTLVVVVVGLGVSLTACSAEGAKERESDEQTPAASISEHVVEISPEVVEREKAKKAWRVKLTGSEWDLELTPMRGKAGKPDTDVLTFSQTSVGSKKLLKAGYSDSSSYALHSPTDKSIAWEAMQLKDEQDMAIWRGEVVGKTMQGTLTKQRNLGDANLVEQFSFTGRRLGPEPEVTPPEAETEPPSTAPSVEMPVQAPEA